MAHGAFGTVINCMDGRVQEPVGRWMKNHFDIDYVDMITEPGPDGLLAAGDGQAAASIRRRVGISVNAHGSRLVAVVSHADCAGNPVTKTEHLRQLAEAVNVVASWDFQVRVLGLWVDEDWDVEFIYDTAAE